jgi:hypothetical protein
MYTPDKWLLVTFKYKGETHYKVLGAFVNPSPSIFEGDSWRLNSGIERWEEDGDYILFHGYSGSTYKCHKDGETFANVMTGVLESLEEQGAKVINYEDFKNENSRSDGQSKVHTQA